MLLASWVYIGKTWISSSSTFSVANSTSNDILDFLQKTWQFWKAYNQQAEPKQAAEEMGKSGVTHKQIQCPFQLLNILFLDKFAADFADLGNIASRQILDSGKAGNQQHFGEHVASTFLDDNETFGQLHFINNKVMLAYAYIDP